MTAYTVPKPNTAHHSLISVHGRLSKYDIFVYSKQIIGQFILRSDETSLQNIFVNEEVKLMHCAVVMQLPPTSNHIKIMSTQEINIFITVVLCPPWKRSYINCLKAIYYSISISKHEKNGPHG